jgi:outer membrane protein TolC
MFVLHRLLWLFPLVVLFLTNCAWADPFDNPAEFISDVLNRHPAVLKGRTLVQAAQFGVKGSRLQPNPTLTLATTAGDAGESSNALTQNFEISGQPHLRWKQSSAQLDSAETQLRATRRVVAANAYRAWLAYWKAERQAGLAELRGNLLTDIAQAARRRFEVGEISQNESLRVELAAVQAEVGLTRAEAARTSAARELLILAGRQLTGHSPPSPLDPLPVLESRTLDEALDAVLLHPEILSMTKQAEALGLASELIGKERGPTLGLSLYRSQLFRTAGVEQGAQLSLSFPLLDWGRISNRRQQAEQQAQAYIFGIEEAVLKKRRQVSQTWALLQAARANWTALEAQAARYEELSSEARVAYDLGMMSLTDVLQTEAAFRNARLELLEAKAELFELELDLLESTGLTWPEELGAVDNLEEES